MTDGLPLLTIMAEARATRTDHVVLAWPHRPDNGFIASALYLLEGWTRGWHSSAKLGFWPWRPGLRWSAHSVLVEPSTLVEAAQASSDAQLRGEPWTRTPFAHQSLSTVLIRLRDLDDGSAIAGTASDAGVAAGKPGEYRVRRPTLVELTTVFPPSTDTRRAAFEADPSGFLKRVRTHTKLRRMGSVAESHLGRLADPVRAPMAMFGLPDARDAELRRYLQVVRHGNGTDSSNVAGLDLVVVDLTRTAVRDLLETWGSRWPERLGHLARAVHALGTERPAMVVLAEDATTMRRAETILREVAQKLRIQGRPFVKDGLRLRRPGFLGPKEGAGKGVDDATAVLRPIVFRADIKDASLLPLRNAILGLAREMMEAGETEAAGSLRAALNYVRDIVNLPLGYAEARDAVRLLYGAADERDTSIRARFFFNTAVGPLIRAMVQCPAHRSALERIRASVEHTVGQWERATPISLKLKAMLESLWTENVLLVLSDRILVDLFGTSDMAVGCRWTVAADKDLEAVASSCGADHWIVVKPKPETIKTLVTTALSPKRVDILGDCAGSALLQMDLRPLTTLAAFEPYAARAKALLDAIEAATGRTTTLVGDEAELTLPRPAARKEIDFTQDGAGAYKGPVVRLAMERGPIVLYRPTSDVLRHTPDELRAFERVQARHVGVGDPIIILDDALMEALRPALARAPRTLDTLRTYHRHVAGFVAGLPGDTRMDKARVTLVRIRSRHPAFGRDEDDNRSDNQEVANIARWMDVDEHTLDAPEGRPRAPRTKSRFLMFAEAIGFPKEAAEVCWDDGIRATRTFRVQEGLLFHQRAIQFIVEPESWLVRETDRHLQPLWQGLLDNVDIVSHREQTNGR